MLKTILIALDCSSASDTVLRGLDHLNRKDSTQIIFIHVIPTVTHEENVEVDRPGLSSDARYSQAEAQLRQYVEKFSNSTFEITQGDPSDEIVRLANIYQADLIVLGTRGLTGMSRIIEDSVSSSVIADAPCSVFVVKV